MVIHRLPLIAALVLASACSVSAEIGDGEYRCTDVPICPSPRMCVDGLCVLPDRLDAALDAPPAGGPGFRRALDVRDSVFGLARDLPLLVVLNDARFDYANALADGSDVHFLDAAGRRLSHEIERWDRDGVSLLWVQIPELSATTTIFVHYGSGSPATPNPSTVWPDYDLVYHFDSDLRDSSDAGFDGTAVGSVTPVGGVIGGAMELGGGLDDQIVVGEDIAVLSNRATVTLSTWVRLSAPGPTLIEVQGGLANDRTRAFLSANGNNTGTFGVRSNDADPSSALSGAQVLELERWIWLLGSIDLTAKTGSLYVDGVAVAEVDLPELAATTADSNSIRTVLGQDDINAVNQLDGVLDEVRISATPVDAARAAIEFLSMSDQLLTYGAAEQLVE